MQNGRFLYKCFKNRNIQQRKIPQVISTFKQVKKG